MSDVEFVSELLIGVIHGPQAGSAKVIDDYYAKYEDFEDEFPDQKRAEALFDKTLKTARRIFPEIRGTRWANKTDFYTLFIALTSLLRLNSISGKISALRKDLMKFADLVAKRLADEDTQVPKHVIQYVRAVEKGANDKARRADRHEALLKVLSQYWQ